MPPKQAAPAALLLTAPGCPHCPGMKRNLDLLVDEGLVASLAPVDIAQEPQRAAALGGPPVPWLQLGEFEFEGLHSVAELRDWARHATETDGAGLYFIEALKAGHLPKVLGMVHRHPAHLDTLLQLAADADTELTVRIGISAVVEDFAGQPELAARLPALAALAEHSDPRVRADACHFLAMTGQAEAVPALETLIQDNERSVRDVAADSLDELREQLKH